MTVIYFKRIYGNLMFCSFWITEPFFIKSLFIFTYIKPKKAFFLFCRGEIILYYFILFSWRSYWIHMKWIISRLLWSCITSLWLIGCQISGHFLNQFEAKPKPIVICVRVFSRASCYYLEFLWAHCAFSACFDFLLSLLWFTLILRHLILNSSMCT